MQAFLHFIQPSYSDKINHLRAIATCSIFIFHYEHFIRHAFFTPLKIFNPFQLLIYHGYFFVYLFFILSGYLLAHRYKKIFSLKLFFTQRLIRIFPAYYLCLVVYVLLFDAEIETIPTLIITIFNPDLGAYPSPLGHLWFMNRLLECYLSFPLLWWVTQKTGRTGLYWIYGCCLIGGGGWVIYYQIDLPTYYFSFILCLSHFILGMLAATSSRKNKQGRYLYINVLALISLLEGFHQTIWQSPLSYSWMSLLWLNFIGFFFIILIRTYLLSPILLPKFLSFIVKQFGKLSYSFYLYHFLVINFFTSHRGILVLPTHVSFLSIFLVSLLCALIFQQCLKALSFLSSKAFNFSR